MSRIEFTRQKLLGMINRIDNEADLQRLVDMLYVEEQDKIRTQKALEKEKEKATKTKGGRK